ncbi:MAG: aspartyl-tRNA(Asn)/glutamyl-tRNA(Gln) amidotransferase subunit C [Arenicella sp.]|jgi:aspartyl-tRNA(Asn)/glutamyl-tRNA(Gln) amidotransferase subunit C
MASKQLYELRLTKPNQSLIWHLTLLPKSYLKEPKNMSLNKQTVETIAHLARLKIEDGEIEKYQSELSSILDLVQQMETCDTAGVEPMTHPFDATMRLRADVISESNQRDKFQALAPSTEDGLYLVPKVIDSD